MWPPPFAYPSVSAPSPIGRMDCWPISSTTITAHYASPIRPAPVFRFGPVMVDPKRIRMPVATDIQDTWRWSHRQDATTWADDPVVNSGGDAQIPADPSQGQEGWLKLSPVPPPKTSG